MLFVVDQRSAFSFEVSDSWGFRGPWQNSESHKEPYRVLFGDAGASLSTTSRKKDDTGMSFSFSGVYIKFPTFEA